MKSLCTSGLKYWCRVSNSYPMWAMIVHLYGIDAFCARGSTKETLQAWLDFVDMNFMGGEL